MCRVILFSNQQVVVFDVDAERAAEGLVDGKAWLGQEYILTAVSEHSDAQVESLRAATGEYDVCVLVDELRVRLGVVGGYGATSRIGAVRGRVAVVSLVIDAAFNGRNDRVRLGYVAEDGRIADGESDHWQVRIGLDAHLLDDFAHRIARQLGERRRFDVPLDADTVSALFRVDGARHIFVVVVVVVCRNTVVVLVVAVFLGRQWRHWLWGRGVLAATHG